MVTKNIILSKADYNLLNNFISNNSSINNFSVQKLSTELRSAKIFDKEKLPDTVVQLHSKVKLNVRENKQSYHVRLVMPQEANIKENKISIFSPMGSAIIGYQKGDEISWEVPAGLKTIQIIDVENQIDE